MHKLSDLHSNQKIVIAEMIQRGVEVSLFDFEKEIIKATYKGHIEYLYDRDSSIIPYNLSILAGDKYLTKVILQDNGISVPLGVAFKLKETSKFLEAFTRIGRPVTLKPVFGSHGYDVLMNIQNASSLISNLRQLEERYSVDTEVLIEEYFPAKEFRIFITREGKYAVLEREPASVIGDGVYTLQELIDKENYRRMHPRDKAWCEILINKEALSYLASQGFDLTYIPQLNQKVFIRPNSNVAMGGLPIDRTDEIHPTAIDIAMKVLNAFQGLPYIGIDFMTKDISKPQTPDSYRIIEINTIPGVDMHYRPAQGKSRNIAKYMVDLIFPETKHEEE